MKVNLQVLKGFCKKYWISLLCVLLGFCAGPFGIVAGIGTGFFSAIIIRSIREEASLRKLMEKGGNSGDVREPFCGCMYLCALGVYCLGDGDSAGRQAQLIFGKSYQADWGFFCSSAYRSQELNGDLLVESLASVLLKKTYGNGKTVPLSLIFKYLQAVEFNWDPEKGEKPSVYLAQLLNYTQVSDEIENAYSILGLDSSASMTEVKKAHRKLAAKYHPDSGSEKNDAEFIRVQKAYELISNS